MTEVKIALSIEEAGRMEKASGIEGRTESPYQNGYA